MLPRACQIFSDKLFPNTLVSVWLLHLRRVSYRQCIDRISDSFSTSIEDVCIIIKVRWQPRKNLATNHDWNALLLV